MGRTVMYAALGALLLLVLSATFVLDHGGARKPAGAAAQKVSLHDLTTAAGIENYVGHTVSTSGTLYFNSATNEHVIIDGNQNYEVAINWSGKLGPFEGKQVLVTGTFRAAPGAGPSIEATSVELDGSPSPTPKDI